MTQDDPNFDPSTYIFPPLAEQVPAYEPEDGGDTDNPNDEPAEEDSGLMRHAIKELDLLDQSVEYVRTDAGREIDFWMRQDILELIRVFAAQGHSGSSASWCIDMFQKLASYQTLTPLTGKDDEWNDVTKYGDPNSKLWQNNRNSSIFKNETLAYYLDGKVFREPDGASYTSSDSIVTIESFPYTPHTEYISVPYPQDQANSTEG